MSAQCQSPLVAIPNFSAGRDARVVGELGDAMRGVTGAKLLDIHSDPDHNRSVFTLMGEPVALVDALLAGAMAATRRIDLNAHEGRHPRVGALDVAPFVHMQPSGRGAACAAALTLADRLGTELELPVFLYGELTEFKRTRADLRRGGPDELQRRIDRGELTPDFGPGRLHPSAGAVLVAARAPLVAFNLVLAPGPTSTVENAREIAAKIRAGGPEGLPLVRAIGVELHSQNGRAQVSTNIEDYRQITPAEVLEAVARHAQVESVEFVGLPPRAALTGLPDTVRVDCHGSLEDALDERS